MTVIAGIKLANILEATEYKLTHFDIESRLLSDSLVTAHAWAPTGQMYAAADSKTGDITVYDSSGQVVSIVKFGELQRGQFAAEEWSLLLPYLAENSELFNRSFFASIKNISWNPDSSEFAFQLFDELPRFYFEDGCVDDGYGNIISCREMPVEIRQLVERYRSLEGVFVARVDGSRITKVASGDGSVVNGPDDGGRVNEYGINISTENLPVLGNVRTLEWLTGARELIVEFANTREEVLLDLDAPDIESRTLLDGLRQVG